MDEISDVPRHGKEINRNWEKYTKNNIQINESNRKERKIEQ